MIAAWAHAPLVLASAFALDRFAGEPPNRLHPVVWMGTLIGALERRAPRGRAAVELVYGAWIALAVPALFGTAAALACAAARAHGNELLVFAVSVVLLKSSFAVRALGEAARRVTTALAAGDLAAAREALRSLCSRDPRALSEGEVVAATIESVAENASDSFVAPIFYFALFGIPGAITYRAINTLDAMIGYHGKYEYLGKASARLDDLANWIPARLTAGALVLAGALLGKSAARGVSTWRRDGAQTESPNAGRPMAAMAGILGVELEKRGHYRLGDALEPLDAGKIFEAWRIVIVAAGLSLAAIGVAHAFAR